MAIISEVLQISLPTGLIVVLIWWLLAEGWPYWKSRDANRRDRKFALDEKRLEQERLEHERRHELEQRQIETDGLMASALTVLADAVRSCPVKVAVEEK